MWIYPHSEKRLKDTGRIYDLLEFAKIELLAEVAASKRSLQAGRGPAALGADTQRLHGCDVLAILDDGEPRIASQGSPPTVQPTIFDIGPFLAAQLSVIPR